MASISSIAVMSRAASGIEYFYKLLDETNVQGALCRTVGACEVGHIALLLASDYTTTANNLRSPVRRCWLPYLKCTVFRGPD